MKNKTGVVNYPFENLDYYRFLIGFLQNTTWINTKLSRIFTNFGMLSVHRCYYYFLSHIFLENILKIPKNPKVILTKSAIWRTPK